MRGAASNIGIIGLGAGSMAAFAVPGDHLDFFEIDPVVERIAEDSDYFTYLDDARQRGVTLDVHLGDARLVLERVNSDQYDLLVIDAFSSDAIPVHLATREAVRLYLDKIREGGILLFHVSNQYLEMRPMLCNIADELGQQCYHQENAVDTSEQQRQGKFYSNWLMMGKRSALREFLNADWQRLQANPDYPIWRDDYSNIFQLLK
jgi:spermidine synthase